VFTFRELLQWILKATQRPRPLVNIPMPIARLQALVMERLPGKPLTRDQLAMLNRDNVVAEGVPGLTDLGITPTPIELVVPIYLERFQPGGGTRPRPLPDDRIGQQAGLSYQARDTE